MQEDALVEPLPPATNDGVTAIAPLWHFVAMIGLLLVFAWLSSGHPSGASAGSSNTGRYLATIMTSWMLLACAVCGIYRRGEFFDATLMRAAKSWPIEILRGGAIYLGVLLLFGAIAVAMSFVGGQAPIDSRVAKAMAPMGAGDLVLWVALSFSAGCCEEIVFRGYLLKQSIALMMDRGMSKSTAQGLSVGLIAVLFGSLHLYEGTGGALLILVLGAVYGEVVLRLGNLRAVIAAHVMQDLFAGLIIFALPHAK